MIGARVPVRDQPKNLLQWVRKYSETLFNLGRSAPVPTGFHIPLTGIQESVENNFKANLSGLEVSVPEWKKQEISTSLYTQILKVGSIEGCVVVSLPYPILDALFCTLVGIDEPVLALQGDQFVAAARKVTGAHLFSTLVEIPEIKPLSISKYEGLIPDENAFLSYDLHGTLRDTPFTAQIALSRDFCLSWKRAGNESSAIEQLASAEVPLILEAGQIRTSLAELATLTLGDFVQIDLPYFSPSSGKMKAAVTLEGKLLFYARIKDGSVKIIETPLQYQELADMPHSIQNTESDEDEMENPFEGEEEDQDSEDPSHEHLENEHPENENSDTDNAAPHEPPVEVQKLDPKDIPITLTVELARLQMSGDQLLELQPGSLLDIDIQPENGVTLSISGKVIGKAELLQVGNVIGVRVLQLGQK